MARCSDGGGKARASGDGWVRIEGEKEWRGELGVRLIKVTTTVEQQLNKSSAPSYKKTHTFLFISRHTVSS